MATPRKTTSRDWHSSHTKPSRPGYYEVRSISGEGTAVWAKGSWWQQDYRNQWMPRAWSEGELEWRREKRNAHQLPYVLTA